MSLLSKLRRGLYRGARVLGDVSALASGRPGRIARRAVNKLIGRKVARRLFFR